MRSQFRFTTFVSICIVPIVLLTADALSGQTQRDHDIAVTIKPVASPSPTPSWNPAVNGDIGVGRTVVDPAHLEIPGISLRMLIQETFGTPISQIVIPGWTWQSYYSVRASIDPPLDAQADSGGYEGAFALLLRPTVESTFKLKYHMETRGSTTRALIALDPSRLGPDISATLPSDEGADGNFSFRPAVRNGNRFLPPTNLSMKQLAFIVSMMSGTELDDGTQITGVYRLSLEWSSEVPSADSGPSGEFIKLSDALKGIGLGIKSVTLQKEFLVIDSVERYQ